VIALNISIFDVLGPIMIGPSSSHTAGAARLAYIARLIVAAPFHHVDFFLHGSFAQTYRGHGTDKALVAGALGMREDDERLVNSFEMAEKAGLTYRFLPIELENAHENTVKMVFKLDSGSESVIIGSSLGGARILITEIDGFPTEYHATSPTLLITQQDTRGVISKITSVLAAIEINIGVMKLSRKDKGSLASCIIETDEPIPEEVGEILSRIPQIHRVRIINTY
jgi:L-serine dehydratase